MPLFRLTTISCWLLLLTIAPAFPQQQPQPQFKSSELQVTVNRAKRNAAGQLVISLRFENVSRENVALYGVEGAGVTTEAGETAEPTGVIGLPLCAASCDNPVAAVGVHVEPVMIEKDGSLLATYVFPGEASKNECSLDLAVRIYLARLGNGTQPAYTHKWRQLSIGLANVKVC